MRKFGQLVLMLLAGFIGYSCATRTWGSGVMEYVIGEDTTTETPKIVLKASALGFDKPVSEGVGFVCYTREDSNEIKKYISDTEVELNSCRKAIIQLGGK